LVGSFESANMCWMILESKTEKK